MAEQLANLTDRENVKKVINTPLTAAAKHVYATDEGHIVHLDFTGYSFTGGTNGYKDISTAFGISDYLPDNTIYVMMSNSGSGSCLVELTVTGNIRALSTTATQVITSPNLIGSLIYLTSK